MPPLAWGGFTFLISYDDLVFGAVGSVALHVVWLLIDTCAAARVGVAEFDLDPVLLTIDAYVCAFVIALDLSIGYLSAQGAVMKRRRHLTLLKVLILPRILGGVCLLVIYMYGVMFKLNEWLRWMGDSKWLFEFSRNPREDLGGWGPVHRAHWVVHVMELVVALRLLILLPGACFTIAVMIPKDNQARIAHRGVNWALRFVGVTEDMISELIAVLMTVIGQGTSDLVVPSDLFFGLQLVAAGQRQGALYFDGDQDGRPDPSASSARHGNNGDCDEEEHRVLVRSRDDLPRPAVRATRIYGVGQAPVPLQPSSNERDFKVLREIAHYIPFAAGIYGLGIELLTESVYEHTSIVSPSKLCGTLCRALAGCRSKPPPPLHGVLGDACCRMHELSMRRALADAAELMGSEPAELLWATWENRGAGTAPPLAVSLDFETRTVVVAVRGTMDMKDCVADLIATPVFFDPLGLAGPDERREAPFDDETGLFAHHTMVKCAQDALSRVMQAGVLDDVFGPAGRASGWGLVTVGHSLGAGVACLLALLLRGCGKAYAADARCVVFEPPGGLLSKRLSELTGRLGFVAAVCANDWISRLSIRTVQDLRERLLDKLGTCDRSKWQLAMLMLARLAKCSRDIPVLGCLLCCCLGGPLARLFECLGGGPLEIDVSSPVAATSRMGFSSVRGSGLVSQDASNLRRALAAATGSRASRRSDADGSAGGGGSVGGRSTGSRGSQGSASTGSDSARLVSAATQLGRTQSKAGFFPELWPPAEVVYFRPKALEWWLCKTYQRATAWTAEWIQPQDLHEIIISPRSAELHFPNIIRDAFRAAAVGLGAVPSLRCRSNNFCADSQTGTSSEGDSSSDDSEDGME